MHPLLTFVTRTAPKRCGVNPAFGRVAELVLIHEAAGDAAFSASQFDSARERAKLALPYNPANSEEYEKCLDVIELAILTHHRDKHGVNAEPERIASLSADLADDAEAVAITESDWWVG